MAKTINSCLLIHKRKIANYFQFCDKEQYLLFHMSYIFVLKHEDLFLITVGLVFSFFLPFVNLKMKLEMYELEIFSNINKRLTLFSLILWGDPMIKFDGKKVER